MRCHVEIYDDSGRMFLSWESPDEIVALTELAKKTQEWRGLGFRNASCYVNQKEQWNLEIKDS